MMERGSGTTSSRTVEVRRTYLTMDSPAALRPARTEAPPFALERRRDITVAEYRALYRDVGAMWHWHERDAWDDARLDAHLRRDDVAVWIASVAGRTAGYFELQRHPGDAVEILYFGLVPGFIGQGLGGALLTRAVEEAWALGATRVWLHTCTLDAPQALRNYLARGFRIEREETYTARID